MALAELFSHPGMVRGDRYAEVLEAFEEVALATLEQGRTLDDVLLLVGRRLCELIGVGRCSVYLRRDDGLFQARAGWERGRSIRASICHLVSGMDTDRFTQEIVSTRRPVLIRDVRRDPRPVQSAMRRFRIRDMLGVPLVVDDAVMGIIYVDNVDVVFDYREHDIDVAQAFATLAAVAVRQHWLHRELEQRAVVINRQRLTLEHLSDAHYRLNEAVVAGAEVPALLQLISELVGKPVLLYTPQLELMSWCPGDTDLADAPALTPRAVRMPWVQRLVAQARTENTATIVPPAPEVDSPTRRLWCPLHLEKEFAGLLEIVELGKRITAIDAKVLERAALAISMRLITERRRTEARASRRRDVLANILYGRGGPSDARDLASADLDPSAPYVLAQVAYADEIPCTDEGVRRREVETLFGSLDEVRETLSTGTRGAEHYALELHPGSTVAELLERLRERFDEFRRWQVRHVVVAGADEGLAKAEDAVGQLDAAVRALASLGAPPQVAHSTDLNVVRLLARSSSPDEVRSFVASVLGPLRAADADGHLLQTLRSFLANRGHVRGTSRCLDVHENTVRYRMNRIRAVIGRDTEDIGVLADLRLALQLHDLMAP